MLAACVRMCVCAYVCLDGQMFTGKNAGKKRKRWQMAGSSRQLSFACSRTSPYKICFEGTIFISEVVHFTLIYIAH